MDAPTLIAKMVLAAAVVVAAHLVVARCGPFLGAMIATLPLSVGPAYVALAFERDAGFVADSALVGLAANAGTVGFAASYAALAPRHGSVASLAAALAVWLGWASMASSVPWSLSTAWLANAAVFACSRALGIHDDNGGVSGRGSTQSSGRTVFVRAALVAALCGAVVLAARSGSAGLVGTFASVPIVLTSLAIVLHPHRGGRMAACVFAHTIPGLVGLALALTFVHLMARPLGSAAALAAALCVAVAWNGMLIACRRWTH